MLLFDFRISRCEWLLSRSGSTSISWKIYIYLFIFLLKLISFTWIYLSNQPRMQSKCRGADTLLERTNKRLKINTRKLFSNRNEMPYSLIWICTGARDCCRFDIYNIYVLHCASTPDFCKPITTKFSDWLISIGQEMKNHLTEAQPKHCRRFSACVCRHLRSCFSLIHTCAHLVCARIPNEKLQNRRTRTKTQKCKHTLVCSSTSTHIHSFVEKQNSIELADALNPKQNTFSHIHTHTTHYSPSVRSAVRRFIHSVE